MDGTVRKPERELDLLAKLNVCLRCHIIEASEKFKSRHGTERPALTMAKQEVPIALRNLSALHVAEDVGVEDRGRLSGRH